MNPTPEYVPTLNVYADPTASDIVRGVHSVFANIPDDEFYSIFSQHDFNNNNENPSGFSFLNFIFYSEQLCQTTINIVDGTDDTPFVFLVSLEPSELRDLVFPLTFHDFYVPPVVIKQCIAKKCLIMIECLSESHGMQHVATLIANQYPDLRHEHFVMVNSDCSVHEYDGTGIHHIGGYGIEMLYPRSGNGGDRRQLEWYQLGKLNNHFHSTVQRIESRTHRPYVFLYQARRTCHNRLLMLSSLHELDLLENGNIGFSIASPVYNPQYAFAEQGIIGLHRMDTHIQAMEYDLLRRLPLILDEEVPPSDLFRSISDHESEKYKTAFVYVVSETSTRRVLISEKTLKSIMALQPFMLHGARYSLKALRECGYKTFGDFFDESYDEEPDKVIRAKMIASEVARISKLTASQRADMTYDMLPILIHNFKTFNTRTRYAIPEVFNEINKLLSEISKK